jgi:hypothetical protein
MQPQAPWSMGDLQKVTAVFFSGWYWYEEKIWRVGCTVTGCVTCQYTDSLNLAVIVLVAIRNGTCLQHFSLYQRRTENSGRYSMGRRCEGVDMYTCSSSQYMGSVLFIFEKWELSELLKEGWTSVTGAHCLVLLNSIQQCETGGSQSHVSEGWKSHCHINCTRIEHQASVSIFSSLEFHRFCRMGA